MFKHNKVFAAYVFAIPLALILGVLAATPDDLTFMLIGTLLFFLALPLFLRWHHTLLIVLWNAAFNVFFLPGTPDVWLVFAALSFGLSVLSHVMGQRPFLPVPEMTRPLLFMTGVVLATAWYRGGIGVQALGGAAHGGRNYILILGAIIGYFALTAAQIPIHKSGKMAGLFFLSGTTYALSNLIYALGPSFFFLYYIVPAGWATSQAASDLGLAGIDRILGLAQACIAGLCFLLVHYGIRGLFDWEKPWRLVFLCVTIGASFFSGYRSAFMLICLIFTFQFYYEGLLRTHFLPIIVGFAIVGFASILLFSDTMPASVQRAVSFLPVKVDSEVLADATVSSDWRFQMWATVWKEVPKYLIIGKGYGIDPTEMFLANEAERTGMAASPFETQLVTGDYHNGPFSVIIPLGILGAMVFLWSLIAGFRVLYSNYCYGDAGLRRTNSVLLSYYLANGVSFFFIFGALSSQLYIFLGAVGLSVSLNGGVKRKTAAIRKAIRVPKAAAMEPGWMSV